MEINLLYKNNQCGTTIYQRLKIFFEDLNITDVLVNDEKYLNIQINKRDNPQHIINTSGAIRNSKNSEIICPILNLNGIACGNQIDETLLRTYEIVLWGFTCFSIKVWGGTRSQSNAKYMRESENPRVVDAARKVLYITGLNFGKVIIAYTARRRYKVLAIDSSPELRDKDMEALIKKIVDLSRLSGILLQNEVKMGADPEFMMFNSKNGRIISASDHFPREGVIGCDNIRIPNRTQRPIAEIRPRPDISPFALTANIKQALNMANQMAPYRNVRWLAGSQPGGGFSIGGHIHFSNVKINTNLLRALDNYVGLPVFLIENPVTAARRRKKYGHLGDYRIKDYGGFEYRTPGSWLVSQNITLAILCLAKLVVSRYLWLPYNYLYKLEAQEAFYHGDQEYFIPIFKQLWSHLERLDMYAFYKDQLQVLYDMIISRTCWNEKTDFRKGWMISTGGRQLSKSKSEQLSNQPNRSTPPGGAGRGTASRAEQSSSSHTAPLRSPRVSTRSNRRPREARSSAFSPRSESNDGGRVIEAHQVRRNYRIR